MALRLGSSKQKNKPKNYGEYDIIPSVLVYCSVHLLFRFVIIIIIIIIIIISIRTKSTNTEKQLTQQYRL